MTPIRVAVFSVVPSPYQRDLLQALAARPEIDLKVYYQERTPHDSPWPETLLNRYEHILPGFHLRLGTVRSHFNWHLPRAKDFDLWIVNSALTSMTTQWLMRRGLREVPWLFWGERLRAQNSGLKSIAQQSLIRVLRHAAGIISVGSLARKDYERRYPDLLHETVPYCPGLDAFFAAGETTTVRGGSDVVFLFCGQMIQRKGIDLLLPVFDRLVREGLPVRLRLVGREAELPRVLSTLSPEARSRICYEGFQAPAALPPFFGAADVFVLPSRYDGWGVVINQALAAGLPILASDSVGAAYDWVENEKNGLRFPPGDSEALYEAMKRTVVRRDLLPEWGRCSALRARELTPESGAQRLLSIINRTLKP